MHSKLRVFVMAYCVLNPLIGSGAPQLKGASSNEMRATAVKSERSMEDTRKYVTSSTQDLERMLADNEAKHGRDHESASNIMDFLSQRYARERRFSQAVALRQRLVSMAERTHGKDHYLVAGAIERLAALYKAQRDFARAQTLLERSLSIWEQLAKRENDESVLARPLHELAYNHAEQRRFDLAEPLFERSLALSERSLAARVPGASPRQLLETMIPLSAVYTVREKYPQAASLYNRMISMGETEYGPSHPPLADLLDRLSDVLHRAGDVNKAKAAAQRAADIRRGGR